MDEMGRLSDTQHRRDIKCESCTYGTAHFGYVLSVRGFEAVGEQLPVAKSSKMQDGISIHQDLVVDSTIYVG